MLNRDVPTGRGCGLLGSLDSIAILENIQKANFESLHEEMKHEFATFPLLAAIDAEK